MPARMRDAPFSRAASEKLQKRRVSPGYGAPLVTVNATKSVPNARASTVAAAAPSTVCADGWSGIGGVGR